MPFFPDRSKKINIRGVEIDFRLLSVGELRQLDGLELDSSKDNFKAFEIVIPLLASAVNGESKPKEDDFWKLTVEEIINTIKGLASASDSIGESVNGKSR